MLKSETYPITGRLQLSSYIDKLYLLSSDSAFARISVKLKKLLSFEKATIVEAVM